jgi:hypothetical protein
LLTINTSDNNAQTGMAFRNSGGLYAWSIHRSAGSSPVLVFSGGNPNSNSDLLTERLRITALGQVEIPGTLTADTMETTLLTTGYAQLDSASVLGDAHITGDLSTASMTVSDSLQIGSAGTAVHGLIAATVSGLVPYLPPNAETFVVFTVAGATVNSVVHISPDDDLPDGIVIGQAYVSAPDTVRVKFLNYETSGNLFFTMDYRIAVINY